jgi:hypothetical protein
MSTKPPVEIKCVSWGPLDHVARTITVTVRVQFLLDKAALEAYLSRGMTKRGFTKFVNTYVKENSEAIEKIWTGQHFKCYTLILKLEAKFVNSRSEVEPDALDVELSFSPLLRNSHTYTTGTEPRDRLSDAPLFRRKPLRGDAQGHSKWKADNGVNEFAHEIAHVLGLDDGYYYDKDGRGQLRPGHIRDMMFDVDLPISAQMITRIIRRSGTGYESQIKCPLSFDAGPSSLNLFLGSLNDVRIHAYACDYSPPTLDRRAPSTTKFTGTCSAAGEYLTQLLPSSPLSVGGSAVLPITFEINPFNVSEKLRIQIAPAVYIEGWYEWNAKLGLPVMRGPLTINGYSSASFFPGPPLWGRFTHGAKKEECPEKKRWP